MAPSAPLLTATVISLLTGIAFGPLGANFIRPKSYAFCGQLGVSEEECQRNLDSITLNFSRLVLGVQLVIAGIQLPSKYLIKEWRSLSLLIGPGMVCMWLATSIIVHIVAAPPSFLYSLAVGACVTPTDPVLSNVIVKGKFADQNFSRELQNLIIAESGANDGLGYPFLFFALYLIRFTAGGTSVTAAGLGESFGVWVALTWGYVILLSILYGAAVGWLGKVLLHWCEQRNFVDRESFLVFAISLALFVLGTCGLIGTDEVLACFVAGNALTWDDWFRVETEDDSLQPTIDMLLNVSVFLWYGAAMPWFRFGGNGVIHTWRLIVLGAAVLLLRRLPWIFTMYMCGWIPEITETKQAVFMGFFGPIGVSAVYYIFVTVDFIEKHLADEAGTLSSEAEKFAELVRTVVWFLCTCSIVGVFSLFRFRLLVSTNDSLGRLFMASVFPSARWGHLLQEPLGECFPTGHWAVGGEDDKCHKDLWKNHHGLMYVQSTNLLAHPVVSGTAVVS